MKKYDEESGALKDFAKSVPQALLDIEQKTRSNLFPWRGQFSPQLIECLLDAYCPPDSVVLDPFAGSGTVLYEACKIGLPAFGYEIAPSAWCFSKIYEFANVPLAERDETISELGDKIEAEFPMEVFFGRERSFEEFESKVIHIGESVSDRARILLGALVVILDVYNNRVTNDIIQSKFLSLGELVKGLPFSDLQIKADLQDARSLPLPNQSVDFAITSPPYINVFNYHQNYRRSVEILGWNLLNVARSEIGSNRANRGNRFCTVIQYCIDMANVLYELARVLDTDGKAIVIIGYESRVLGTPFYNADIVEGMARRSSMFDVVLRQQREFVNRFGMSIREDVLNLQRTTLIGSQKLSTILGRSTAMEVLDEAKTSVPPKNKSLLIDAISRIESVKGTPIFDSTSYPDYQTRDKVMMVKDKGGVL